VLWAHNAGAGDTEKTIAIVMKESNKAIVEVLKESNAQTQKVLEKINDQAQKQAEAQRETNCLLSLPQDRRTNAAEICKRIAR
jgi:hypothetical protein